MSDEKEPRNVYRDVEWQMIERRLNSDKPQERYIEPEVLAHLIEAYAGAPLPDGLTRYICQTIRGEIKRPKGRPTHKSAATRDTYIYMLYATFTELLAARNEDPTLDGWDFLLKENAQDRAPHEQAALMVVEFINRIKGFPTCDVSHVRSLVTKARKKTR